MKKWISILNPRRWTEKGFVIAAFAAGCLILTVSGVKQIRFKRRLSQENVQRLQPHIETSMQAARSNAELIKSNKRLIDKILENQRRQLRQQKQREGL